MVIRDNFTFLCGSSPCPHYRFLEASQLIVWQGPQERLQQYNRFPQASIEIVMGGIDGIPQQEGIHR
jgi:hypothetical protein